MCKSLSTGRERCASLPAEIEFDLKCADSTNLGCHIAVFPLRSSFSLAVRSARSSRSSGVFVILVM